ncbi:gliding motility-associated C-terminal domain-containing protein, partial [Imtechella halotolerans]
NFVETTATFTIEDTTAPTFTAPENIEIFIDAECSYDTSVAVTGDVEDENDGCSTDLNATFEDTIIPGCGSSFTIERTWTLADNCGNQAEPQVQIIKVTDNIPPIIDKTGLRNLVVECGTDYLADLNEWLNNNAGAVAIDNCDDVTWTHNFEGLEEGCSNDIIVRFTATDECGNQAETKATFTIKDTQAPTITLQPEDKTVECDGQGNTEAFEEWLNSNGGATATDECSVFNWSNDYSEQSWVSECETVKYAEVTFTASDACNNVAMTQKVRFTIEDTTAPVFVEELPGDLTVECNEVPEAAVLTVTEQCDSSITVDFNEEITYDTEVCSTNYTIVRTWTATDCAGNIATHTQNIRVEDTTAPVFTAQELPGNLTVECDDVPEAITLTATDNCSGETEVTFTEEITDTSETCGSSYVITRTWTTSDCAGNTTTHVQTITVRDITAPIMLTELDEEITVSCSEIPAVPTVIFNDNCTGSEELVVTFNETSTRTDEISDYNIIRTWKATDLCGNETEFTQTIKVQLNDQVTPYELDICIEDAEINLFSLLAQGYEQGGVWETPANFNLRDGSWLDPANIALGEYTFYYTVTDSDCPSRTQVNVKINDDCVVLACTADDIIISKVVTPNGDGQNDFFTIEGIDPECGFTFDVKLFNRWGDFIFESNNYQNNWNGQAPSGAIGAAGKIPTGTYFYIINVRNSGIKPITGYIYFATK